MTLTQTTLNDIEKMLIETANQAKEIYDISSDFQESNKNRLPKLVEKFDHSLGQLNEYCGTVAADVKKELVLPYQVLKDIDDGFKPDSYGKECVDMFRANHRNERIRSEGLNKLYTYLCDEIRANFDSELAENIIKEANAD
ncbi:hypothetical protein EHI8A_027480 [Entamoeba histolytica HM-1:IMSS-B]|uniref:Mediator of RNA polymerase II transcription subunit 10 n=8 Tax=Entamoeba TaxID=5758 RepID=C4LYB1_ENTH1|nr:hypothetical protein ENU1_007740 [Entamoeba nuttalli P19]XP_654779.1 hypothetical protein EHI_167110 [Entamoeba histolytica HM-1:IMSS]EMD44458.1 Hypothetical protein EHI5A_054290 [Entamoeba histolytica KU27]EMH74216.1 hypothetical protein EHI8A_027480 [Entamoeba histolytica HM-1:IMSS-B]EMS15821.1 hypothetical protein KM1_065330 [Entamoeba histolytica HM-3:IMSS]ENY65539.1 hypothetical protein EHI7A_030600 [Entamoeba histolytica HM-1:IMSS-A]GAT93798.1 hypothetical protein CL6EHI_167110 [Enta|eukprot:XP_008854807.1 hypothetical protein ENU1_007740 [Entamoeba nuttalli P19]